MSPTTASVTTIRPPAPRPCSARNAISCAIDCARPQSTEPTRKIDDRRLQHLLAAVEVAELPVERPGDRRGEQVRGHDPREVRDPAEVADDRRQRRRDDRLVERGEQQHEEQRGEDQADARLVVRHLLQNSTQHATISLCNHSHVMGTRTRRRAAPRRAGPPDPPADAPGRRRRRRAADDGDAADRARRARRRRAAPPERPRRADGHERPHRQPVGRRARGARPRRRARPSRATVVRSAST